jgi:epoxyqueuosine reductase
LMGNWVYGCDVCQDVCPWQRFNTPTQEPLFRPSDADRAAPPLLDLLALTPESFKARYAGSPIERIKRDRLVRNACIAAGNWGSEAAVRPLTALLDDPSPLVRGHAAWGLARIIGHKARQPLIALLDREADPEVHAEVAAVLDTLP